MGTPTLLKQVATKATQAVVHAAPETTSFLEKAYMYLLRGGYTYLNKLGPAGEYLSTTLRDQPTLENNMAGQVFSKMNSIWEQVPLGTRLATKVNPSVVAAQVKATTPEVQNIAQQLALRGAKRKVFNVALGRTQNVPYSVPEDFFPTILTDKVLRSGKEQEALIDHLIATNQTSSRTQAKIALDRMRGEMLGARGFEYMTDFAQKTSWTNIPSRFLELDPIVAYSEWGRSAARYITKRDLYGPKLANLATAVDIIDKQFGYTARNYALNVIDVHEYGYGLNKVLGSGQFYGKVTDWERYVRNFEGLTKLGRIAIAEPSQLFNAWAITNATTFARTLNQYRMNPKQSIEYAIESGALSAESIRDLKRAIHGQDTWLDSLLRYTGFDVERKFNIIISANAGKNYAMSMAEKLLVNKTDAEANYALRSLGLEPSRIFSQGGLNPADIMKAGRRAAELTQFFHNPADVPIAWSANPIMRTAFLYKNFIVNQARFSYEYLIKKSIATKNFNNLFAAALVFPVVGELVGDVETLTRGENPVNYRVEHSPFKQVAGMVGWKPSDYTIRYLDNLSRVGNIGLFYSMLGSMTRDNVVDWLAGPVAGDITDLVRIGKYLAKGEEKKAGKLITRRIPTVGPIISKALD